MSSPEVSIIIPTRNRSHLLTERLEILINHTPEIHSGEAEVIIAYDKDDEGTAKIARNFPGLKSFICEPLEIPCNKWNLAAKEARESKWLVTMSDDSKPHDRWLTNALLMISFGFIALPDGVTGTRNELFTPLYMATRQWLKYFNGGYLVPPYYKSWYGDMEIAEKAHRSKTYILGKNSVVEQLHANFGTAPDDEIYSLGASRRRDDSKMFEARKKLGFPDEIKGVL